MKTLENLWLAPIFFQILGISPQIEEFVVLKSNIEDYKSFLNLKYSRLRAGINIGLRLSIFEKKLKEKK